MSKTTQGRPVVQTTFAATESGLAQVHDIPSVRRAAFQARLKNLIRLGLLPDVPAGRGRTGSFEPWHILQLAMALELAQLGLSPARSVEVLRRNRWMIAQGVSMLSLGNGLPSFDKPVIMAFSPKALCDTDANDDNNTVVSFQCWDFDAFTSGFEASLRGGLARASVVNFTLMVGRLIIIFANKHFAKDLATSADQIIWLERREEIIDSDIPVGVNSRENDASDPQA